MNSLVFILQYQQLTSQQLPRCLVWAPGGKPGSHIGQLFKFRA
jgi:hypothetical protein